jgi:hypothetical protein
VADAPTWAETLLSTAIRIHGRDPRKVRRAIAGFEEQGSMYDPPEKTAAFAFVLEGLKKHLAAIEEPERERGP